MSGNEFQTDGPATEKAHQPNKRSWYHGMTRSRRLADHRCCCHDKKNTNCKCW